MHIRSQLLSAQLIHWRLHNLLKVSDLCVHDCGPEEAQLMQSELHFHSQQAVVDKWPVLDQGCIFCKGQASCGIVHIGDINTGCHLKRNREEVVTSAMYVYAQ